jgi:ribosomal protein S18 acetylase RimI-like enzyme
MILIRPAGKQDCETIAEHIRRLAKDIGVPLKPKVTAGKLAAQAFGIPPLIRLFVAEEDGVVKASSVSCLIYSTWRGERGLYVIDLYVQPEARSSGVGLKLLRETARAAWAEGARFIRLDVDHANLGAMKFYERHGFTHYDHDKTFAMDEATLVSFLAVK